MTIILFLLSLWIVLEEHACGDEYSLGCHGRAVQKKAVNERQDGIGGGKRESQEQRTFFEKIGYDLFKPN